MPDCRSHRILIVGDAQPTMEVLKSVLFAAGTRRIAQATSGREALDHLARNACDLALVDCSVISDEWLALVRQLRASSASRDLPILLLAGRHDQASAEAAKGAGADGVLAKPLAPATLMSRIAALLQARRYVVL